MVVDKPDEPDFAIYHISYIWYTLFGALITISVSLIVTFAIGANEPSKVDPKLLSPCIRRYMRIEEKREDPLGTEDDIRYADFVDLKAISTTVWIHCWKISKNLNEANERVREAMKFAYWLRFFFNYLLRNKFLDNDVVSESITNNLDFNLNYALVF